MQPARTTSYLVWRWPRRTPRQADDLNKEWATRHRGIVADARG
jgi:hypothetical protein